jgi:type II secretion system protein G
MKTLSIHRGFTLIELLVVIAIIGLLSSVVLASLNTARAKARDALRMESVRELQKAVEMYYSTTGHYPNDGGSGTYADCWKPNANWIPDGSNYNWSSGYISTQPQDPIDNCCWPEGNCGSAGQAGTYEYWSNGSQYLISARLENTSSPYRAGVTGVIDPRSGGTYATTPYGGNSGLAQYCFVVTN